MQRKFDYISHYKTDAEVFDYFEERRAGTKHDERRVHEYIISQVPASAKTVLDIGSGSAWVANEFIPKGIKITSLDISFNNVKKAKNYFPNKNHFQVNADSFNLPFVTSSFDCIIASEVIEHVVDPKNFIEELFRVVKSKGILLITTPYKEIIQYCLCIHCNQKTPLHGHLHSFDERKLLSLYNKNDLKITRWKTFGNKLLIFLRLHVILNIFPFPIWKIIDWAFNKIINKPAHILVGYVKK